MHSGLNHHSESPSFSFAFWIPCIQLGISQMAPHSKRGLHKNLKSKFSQFCSHSCPPVCVHISRGCCSLLGIEILISINLHDWKLGLELDLTNVRYKRVKSSAEDQRDSPWAALTDPGTNKADTPHLLTGSPNPHSSCFNQATSFCGFLIWKLCTPKYKLTSAFSWANTASSEWGCNQN